jgi:hypothetical protein
MKNSKALVALVIFVISALLPGVALAQSGFFGSLIRSETEKTETKFHAKLQGALSLDNGQDAKITRTYTCLGAVTDFTPHFAANVPGCRSYLWINANLSYVALANGDTNYDKKAQLYALNTYLKNNKVDPRSTLADEMRKAIVDGKESPDFTLFVRIIGTPVEDSPVMTWNAKTQSYEGAIETTNLEPGTYQMEYSYGLRGSRTRIQLFSWCINKPSSQTVNKKDGEDIAIVDGHNFKGITPENMKWLNCFYIQRATFKSHMGHSWSKKDSSGGYVAAMDSPDDFDPETYFESNSSTPPVNSGKVLTPNGKTFSQDSQTVKNSRLRVEIVDHVTEKGQLINAKAFRITTSENFTIKFVNAQGQSAEAGNVLKAFAPAHIKFEHLTTMR